MTEFGRQIRVDVDAILGRYSPGNHMVTWDRDHV